MENHNFSVPVPVRDAPRPTWSVDVVRKTGGVLVGTLTIDSENLPPRKNKKKIAWKLPDDPEVIPKFGEHERKRLWELFKEQKKERRRSQKKLTTQSSSGDYDASDTSALEVEPNPPAPNETAHTTYSSSAPPDQSLVKGSESGAPEDNGGAAVPVQTAPVATTLKESQNTRGEAIPPISSSSYQPLYGRGAANTPPPPPGFNMDKLSLEERIPKSIASVPTGPAAAPPPPPVPPLHTNTPPPPGIPPSLHPSLPPALYFTLENGQPLAALGALVAPLFLQCVTTSTMAPWLAHSHLVMSQTTLSLGTAQATAMTYPERLQQWQSLTLSNRWDCTGCTSQTLPLPNTVLLVLTGRTIQKQEWLVYHLSLILTATSNRNFQITNEVLSLTALSSVPVTG